MAPNLRLELAQAAQLLPPSHADDAYAAGQRTRAKAVEAALTCQVAGSPLPLSSQMALLHALDGGHLDALASSPPEDLAAAVASLLHSAATHCPSVLEAIDATGELDEEGRAQLLEASAAVLPLPAGTRRAFFGAYDATTWQGS